MENIVRLKRASEENASEIHMMQKKAFSDLLERYQDYNTNPGNDTLEKVVSKLNREDTEYHFIVLDELKVGVIHIKQLYKETNL